MATEDLVDDHLRGAASVARERIQKLAGALAQLTKARRRGDQAAIERWQRVVAEEA